MRRCAWLTAALAVTLALAAPAHAAAERDEALAMARAVRAISLRLGLAPGVREADSVLTALFDRFELETGGLEHVSFRQIGRMHHTRFIPDRAQPAASAAADLDEVKFYVHQTLIPAYRSAFGPDSVNVVFAPFDHLNRMQTAQALGHNQRALERYARKYGPGSARLNLLEMALNRALQGIEAFGPGADGPGPLEFIAGYSTSYFTFADERAAAATGIEVGLRCYVFDPGWGAEKGFGSYFRPRFASAGLLAVTPRDGALRSPFEKGDWRLGAFVTWGGIKLAWVGGDRSRFLVSRQVHLIPNVF